MNTPRTAAEARRAGWRQVTTPPSDSPAVEALAAIIAHPKTPADVRRFEGPETCDRCPRALAAAEAVLAAGYRLMTHSESLARQLDGETT